MFHLLITASLLAQDAKVYTPDEVAVLGTYSVTEECNHWGLSQDHIYRSYCLAKQYKDLAGYLCLLDPLTPRHVWVEDAAARFVAWDELDNVKRLGSVWAVPRLHAALGYEAWTARRMPAPTPWGYAAMFGPIPNYTEPRP
jgi:hypothetical protein